MDSAQQAATVALGAIKELSALHGRFIAELEVAAQRISDIGSLAVSSNAITCTCLRHKVTASHRPIAVAEQVSAMEYDFTVEWNGERLSILRLFLQPNGVLSRDAQGNSKFQDFNNSYINNHILAAVSSALINSPVFSAREG